MNMVYSFLIKNLSKHVLYIISIFLIWRVLLTIFSIIAREVVPLGYKDKFLGGGLQNYSLAPEIFGWANFDGEHFLSIAIFGYKGLEQAFFPVYPKLISIINIFGFVDLPTVLLISLLIGIFISNLSLILALIFLWELVRIDFSSKIAYWTVSLVLIFPTSFYFTAVYSESLFLLFSVASFFYFKKQKYILAGILGGFSSATRLFGVLLLPAILIETIRGKRSISRFIGLMLIPLGLVFYMLYLWITVNDPIAFYTLQKLVGEQRYSNLILPPQIIYRYINILISVDYRDPIYQTVVLELFSGLLFLILPIYGYFKKLPRSYIFYTLGGFLMSSIQGSFSSVPRYILVFFPVFIVFALITANLPRYLQIILIGFSLIILSIETMLFLRGYWIA